MVGKKLTVEKDILTTAAQACVNSYNGRWGNANNNLFNEQKVFYDAETRWYMGYNKKQQTAYIVFQGTVNKAGWENNFDYQQVRFDGARGYIHKGFYRDEVEKVFPDVWKELTKLYHETETRFNVVVCGHSKGASNALLCAAQLKAQDLPFVCEIKCVAFAPARVGSPVFARTYKKLKIPTMIFKYGNDMVCKVPPPIAPGLIRRRWKFLWMNYWPTIQLWKHPVKVTHLGAKWYTWLLHCLPVVRFFGNPLDHKPQNYLKAVKNL